MSIYPVLDLPSLQRLHDDIEDEADPAELLMSLFQAEVELIASVFTLDPTGFNLEPTAEPSPAAIRHWANFMVCTRERVAHFHRLQMALDLRGKDVRRARRLSPHTGSL